MAKDPPCDYAACLFRFKVIDEKLDTMHEDFKRLEQRVLNGLTERISEVEKQVAISGVQATRKEKLMMIWQTAIISAVVAICVALGSFLVGEYIKHQHEDPPVILKTPSKKT